MKPVKRYSTSKHGSAKQFSRRQNRTKALNVAAPMRGGIRL